MNDLRGQISSWLPEMRERIEAYRYQPKLEHIGRVRSVGDGVAAVSGLPWTKLGEVIRFESGLLGVAFRVDEDLVGCVLISGGSEISAGTKAWGTGSVYRVPVGEALLGRVVDPVGTPIDGGPPVEAESLHPVDREAPAIVDRAIVETPLQTGLIAIDTMIPLGRGQRELIIGDRKTGKTAIAVDTIINQRDSDVVCIYAAVGQKAVSVSQVIDSIREHGPIERTIVVVGASNDSPGSQWMAPFAACTMAEYFRDRGQDALLVIDDLTKHAIAYRELSLLLRRPPGREAYPGDIFYVHARLLERAARMSPQLGGGSLTALPIAETQAGNLTAYIPTNLISITDGQVYLDTKLFYEGQRPAVDVGLSVSRVGGKTQSALIRKLAETMRLDYAQFLELEMFARFGAMVDERTRRTLDHGERIRAILRQNQYEPLSVANQAALLLALKDGAFERTRMEDIAIFRKRIGQALREKMTGLAEKMDAQVAITDAELGAVGQLIESLASEFESTPGRK